VVRSCQSFVELYGERKEGGGRREEGGVCAARPHLSPPQPMALHAATLKKCVVPGNRLTFVYIGARLLTLRLVGTSSIVRMYRSTGTPFAHGECHITRRLVFLVRPSRGSTSKGG
jgi:hypothetical protein